MAQTVAPLYRLVGRTAVALACLLVGCVYHMDIQQGNRIEADDLEQVQVGMSQSAVQFLLGTPMIADPFHADRWDYPYYLRRGRSREPQQSWFAVYFEEGRVTRVDRELEALPNS
jgi:outer membrane protein assembly factor BamE